MSVFNGQLANATTFNNAFLSRTVDSSTVGRITLANADPASGASISNIQREFNSQRSFLGSAANQPISYLPPWTASDVGAPTDPVFHRVDAITAEFNATSGHSHDGTTGSGGPISSLNLSDFNKFFAEWQTDVFDGASGASDDVSAVFTGRTPGGGPSDAGVPTSTPYNRVVLRTKPNHDKIEEPGGKEVYGRLTESSGTWTLTYFYEDTSGVETAYTLPTQDIRLYWREVFDASTRPTFGTSTGFVGSFDATADIVDASPTQPGRVNTSTQSFGGEKTFVDRVVFEKSISTERLDVPSAATITALSSTNSFVKLTGAVATELQGISAPSSSVRMVVYNASGSNLTVKHENTGASAPNRIITKDGTDLIVVPSASVEFIYDLSDSRWRVVSTSGGGGVALEVEYRTITLAEETAEALTLAATPSSATKVMVDVIGGSSGHYGVDYIVTGSTLDWSSLGYSGLLSAGDVLRIHYPT